MTVPWRKPLVACLVVLVVTTTCAGAILPRPTDAGADADGRVVPSAMEGPPTAGDARAGPNAPASPDAPTIRARFAFSQHPEPGVVTVRVTFDPPSNVRSLEVGPATGVADRLDIVDATGFSAAEDGDAWTWEADPPHPIDPSLTIRYEVNDSERVFGGLNFVGTGKWALFSRPELAVRWSYRDTPPAYEETMAVSDDATGYATPTMGYLGPYETYEATRNGQRFVLVVPAAADPTTPAAVFDTLESASRLLDVGGVDDRVVAFRAPVPIRRGGLAMPTDGSGNDSAPDSIWVSEGAKPSDPTYVSEYVHTRQTFDATDRMAWITEAQDVYFSSLVALYLGTYSYEGFRYRVATEANADAVLASPDRSVTRRRADYEKGARVLAALDAEIRRSTGRNRSVEDVWRRMNAHEGTLNYTDFKAIVADVANRSLDDWLDRYLTTSAAPDVPDNRTLFAPLESGIDADSDGLVTDAELDAGTDPFVADTDGDGTPDGEEVDAETDPLNANDGGESDPRTTDTPESTESDESGLRDAADRATETATGDAADDRAIETTTSDDDRATETATGGDAEEADGPRDDAEDESADDPAETVFLFGLLSTSAASLLLAALTLLARALDRLVGVAPGVLVRRSVGRLLALAVASAAVFVAHAVWLA